MEVSREEKLEQLERVLQSHVLHSSDSLRGFLRFVVSKAVDNQESQLKEYVIATEVFGRNDDYNPRIDSTVRVQAGRLRTKLHEYYSTEGKGDRVIIDLPKGQYMPVFSYAEEEGQLVNGKAAANVAISGPLIASPAMASEVTITTALKAETNEHPYRGALHTANQ